MARSISISHLHARHAGMGQFHSMATIEVLLDSDLQKLLVGEEFVGALLRQLSERHFLLLLLMQRLELTTMEEELGSMTPYRILEQLHESSAIACEESTQSINEGRGSLFQSKG